MVIAIFVSPVFYSQPFSRTSLLTSNHHPHDAIALRAILDNRSSMASRCGAALRSSSSLFIVEVFVNPDQ